MPFRWSLLVFLAISVGGGLLIGATNIPGEWYEALKKPPGTPPGWVFGPVWTVLYVLIGIAGWRAFEMRKQYPRPVRKWSAQMGLNFAWSPTVFTFHNLVGGMVIICALWLVCAVFIACTWKRDRLSAYLFVPYLAWVSYATYLNAGLTRLN